MSELIFRALPAFKFIAFVGFATILAVSLWIWIRSGYQRRILMVESLRILVAGIAALTLLQPELRTSTSAEQRAVIAILHDASLSMDTQDVVTGEEGPVPTRAEWVEQRLEEEFWKGAAGGSEVIVEAFSAPPSPEEAPHSGTNINNALLSVLERYDNLQGVILMSDGDWNVGGNPIEAASRYFSRQVPVFGVPVGSPIALPDLAVTHASAPAFGIVGDRVQVTFTIRNTLNETVRTTVSLTDEDGDLTTKEVELPALRETTDSMFYIPRRDGTTTLALDVPVHPDELIEDNNTRRLQVTAREESIKVLIVDSLPRWEYRYIRNALYRDPGVTVNSILFHPDPDIRGGGPGYLDTFPDSLQELSDYDVIFLGDVGIENNQLTIEQTELLRQLVEQQASGIVFLPGSAGNQISLLDTELGDLIPVLLDTTNKTGARAPIPSSLVLTQAGNQNLLTILTQDEAHNAAIWRNLPGFYWHAPVIKARAGSEVLAVHETMKNEFGRLPLLVTNTAGNGKVLFMGTDGAWRWRRGVEDLYHYRFWGQVARWMSYQRKMAEGERLRIYYTPDNPMPGQTLTLNANAYDRFGAPLQNGSVTLTVSQPDGRSKRLEMTPTQGGLGSFFGRLAIEHPGEYTISAYSPENDETVTTTFYAEGEPIERIGQPARPEVLAEISRISRGSLAQTDNLPGLVEQIRTLPQPQPVVRYVEVWSHWGWALLLVTSAGIFWIARKAAGQI